MKKNSTSEPTGPAGEAVEIVTFRLMRGVSFAEFIDANRDVDAWLLLQPGFRSRRIGEQPGACVVDVLLWHSEAAARAAMHKLMDELADSPVHALIDQDTVTWTVAGIRHSHAIDGCRQHTASI
ncbi:MAG TPA: hypothetical protein VF861_11775 [Telluria sp.]